MHTFSAKSDLMGQIFNDQTVIREEVLTYKNYDRGVWICRCKCGIERKLTPYQLIQKTEVTLCKHDRRVSKKASLINR